MQYHHGDCNHEARFRSHESLRNATRKHARVVRAHLGNHREQRDDTRHRAKQAELFLETLKRLPEQAKLESTELFMSLVDKVIVGDGLTFIMRDGTERNVNGVR